MEKATCNVHHQIVVSVLYIRMIVMGRTDMRWGQGMWVTCIRRSIELYMVNMVCFVAVAECQEREVLPLWFVANYQCHTFLHNFQNPYVFVYCPSVC